MTSSHGIRSASHVPLRQLNLYETYLRYFVSNLSEMEPLCCGIVIVKIRAEVFLEDL